MADIKIQPGKIRMTPVEPLAGGGLAGEAWCPKGFPVVSAGMKPNSSRIKYFEIGGPRYENVIKERNGKIRHRQC